jgi:hypothetical protein
MSNLSAFLAENAIPTENARHIASKRFVGEDGKPLFWDIGCVTSSEDEALRKASTKRVPVPGKRNQFTQDLDVNLYLGRLAAKCTLFPNLDDAELQNSYGVMGADALLKTMLTPGEYADYLLKVQEVNGFDTTFDDEVDEAKN